VNGPSPRQLDALRVFSEFQGVHGFPPTMRDIGRRLGIRSTNAVNDLLRGLERKGYIEQSKLSRGRLITPKGKTLLENDKPEAVTVLSPFMCSTCGHDTFAAHPLQLCRELTRSAT
jgi:DNA-binding MarR family transcriptional regulator